MSILYHVTISPSHKFSYLLFTNNPEIRSYRISVLSCPSARTFCRIESLYQARDSETVVFNGTIKRTLHVQRQFP